MEHEIAIRLISFALIFILIALWEIRAPRRTLMTSKKWRWFNNLSIIAVNPVLLRMVFPVLAIGMAQTAQANGWGLLNHLGTPSVIALFVGIIALDLVVYLQHVIICETNSNYGFKLSIWDRLFGTYLAQPYKGHQDMIIGLSQFRDHRQLTLPWLLILPFFGDLGKQPINR